MVLKLGCGLCFHADRGMWFKVMILPEREGAGGGVNRRRLPHAAAGEEVLRLGGAVVGGFKGLLTANSGAELSGPSEGPNWMLDHPLFQRSTLTNLMLTRRDVGSNLHSRAQLHIYTT